MIITYSLETLITSPLIDEICIIAEEDWQDAILKGIKGCGISTDKILGFAAPGYSRQSSILNGLQYILETRNPETDDSVLIHDAARPLLTMKQIEECFDTLPGHDGVMPVLPMCFVISGTFCSNQRLYRTCGSGRNGYCHDAGR